MVRLRFLFILTCTPLFPLLGKDSFTYTGQILVKNDDCIVIKGSEWAGWVNTRNLPDRPFDEGDVVRVTGNERIRDWLTIEQVVAKTVTVITHAALPPTLENVDGGLIPDGRLEFQFVRTQGTVISVSHGTSEWNWILIRTPTGDVGVTIREKTHSIDTLKALLDAEISVRGIVVYSWGRLGAHISLRGENALKILVPPPSDPFSLPEFEKVGNIHRQTLSGTIAASGKRRLVVQNNKFGIVQVIPTSDGNIPDIGHKITVAGFAETDPIRLKFTEAIIRDDGPGDVKHSGQPITVDRHQLKFPSSIHGNMIVTTGTVRGSRPESFASDMLSLDVEGFDISIDLTSILDKLKKVPVAGSVVQIKGICIAEYTPPTPLMAFPDFRNIIILPQYANDIVVIKTPPWWTPGKFLLCLGLIALFILFREIHSRNTVKLKLKERTMLAIEIHDSLAQFLMGISLQLDSAEMAESAGMPDAAKKHISCAKNAMKSCRENLRYCLGDLRRCTSSEAKITDIIRNAVLPNIGGTTLLIRFNVPRNSFKEPITHAISSIIRELSVNAVRHGSATRIHIAGELRNGKVRFSVKDNGTGFDPEKCPGVADGHYGLAGIKERLKELKGTILLSSDPGKGSKAIVSLPL